MDETYDVVILGTGLKECILSGLLSSNNKRVLHMDRNNYYGGDAASLNLKQLYAKFRPDEKCPEDKFGKSKYYNVDLCPKFIMACGNLVKMLLHCKVTHYLQFRSVQGSYVCKDGGIHKVPATAQEALNSGLMGIFQKRRFKNFLQWASEYKQSDPKTYQGADATKMTCEEVFSYWKLDANTVTFVGHSIALYPNDDYLKEKFASTLEKIQLYAYSVSRYGNSPYIYPVWGLGGLPESFSRKSAIHGGVYMLNKKVEEIMYDDNGKVTGVKAGGEVAKCSKVICDPSYVAGTKKVKKVGEVARWLFILSHAIKGTNNAHSAQIIIPAKQLKRNSDIYISVISSAHEVANKGKYIAMVTSYVETDDPKKELGPAVKFLGDYDADFFSVSDLFVPEGDGTNDNVYVTSSYDATTHFENTTVEVLKMYENITGEKLDLNISAEPEDLKDY